MLFENLPLDVQTELADKTYVGQTHGKLSTSHNGCQGPLCRYRVRSSSRQRYAARRKREGKTYVPEPHMLRSAELDTLLERIYQWHQAEVLRKREVAKKAAWMAYQETYKEVIAS